MKIKDMLAISWQNVVRSRSKSLLSVIAISVGVFSVSMISSLGETVGTLVEEKVLETGLGGIAVFTDDAAMSVVNDGVLEYIENKVEGIKGITPFLLENGSTIMRGTVKKAAFIGVGSQFEDVVHVNVLYGDLFNDADIAAKARVAIVDEEFAMEYYKRANIIGKKLVFRLNGIREEFVITAVISSQKHGLESMTGMSLPTLIYLPYTTIYDISGKNTSDKIIISCAENLNESDIAAETARELGMFNNIKYKYENIDSYISGLWDMVDIVKMFVSAVAAISLFVGGIGIMNSMMYTVDSRKNDIGICIALGEKRRSIMMRFLIEAVMLCVSGGALGLGMIGLSAIGLKMLNIDFSISWAILLKSLGTSFACGIIFGIVPAHNAARFDPIDIINK